MIAYSCSVNLVGKKSKGGKKSLKLEREGERRAFCLILEKMEWQIFTVFACIYIYIKGAIEAE